MKSKNQKFYAVKIGSIPGIYNTWTECKAQTNGFPGSQFKSFTTFDDASEYIRSEGGSLSPHSTQPILDSYCVDGACSGNPGPIEYRCVNTETKEEIFRQGFEGYGTNNISEFLAIVHALAVFKDQGISNPIYSDSATALTWVEQKRCNTNLKTDPSNAILLDAIDRAERWLSENTYINVVLKWQTHLWGEIPADFGRK